MFTQLDLAAQVTSRCAHRIDMRSRREDVVLCKSGARAMARPAEFQRKTGCHCSNARQRPNPVRRNHAELSDRMGNQRCRTSGRWDCCHSIAAGTDLENRSSFDNNPHDLKEHGARSSVRGGRNARLFRGVGRTGTTRKNHIAPIFLDSSR